MSDFSYVISYEPTANERSYKFTINHDFAGDAMWECDSEESAFESPLAASIWSVNQIDKVFFDGNLIMIHKTENGVWLDLIQPIINAIDAHFRSLRPLFSAEESDERIDVLRQIIADYIQPGLISHGGFVKLVNFEGDNLTLSMHGACNGCSSADLTLEFGIKRLINFYYPEINVELSPV